MGGGGGNEVQAKPLNPLWNYITKQQGPDTKPEQQ